MNKRNHNGFTSGFHPEDDKSRPVNNPSPKKVNPGDGPPGEKADAPPSKARHLLVRLSFEAALFCTAFFVEVPAAAGEATEAYRSGGTVQVWPFFVALVCLLAATTHGYEATRRLVRLSMISARVLNIWIKRKLIRRYRNGIK